MMLICRPLRLIILAVLFLQFNSAIAAEFIKRKDQRLPKEYAENARGIGFLNQGRKKRFCTAFCIKDDVIATAAHCIEGRGGISPNRIEFQLSGKKRITSRIFGETSQEVRLNTIVGTTLFVRRGADQNFYDWALARLAKPICVDRELNLGKFDWSSLIKNPDVNLVFPHLRKPTQMRISDCDIGANIGSVNWSRETSLIPFPDDFILHNCVGYPGTSGSPLIEFEDDGARALGIHSGHKYDPKTKKNIAHVVIHIHTIMPYLAMISEEKIYPTNELILQTQKILRETGDYTSSLDGKYGKGTRQAIMDFTRRHALPIMTDRPSEELLAIMEHHRSPALPKFARRGFEAYTYARRVNKVFAIDRKRKKWHFYDGMSSARAAISGLKILCESCEIYSINDQFVLEDKSNLAKLSNVNEIQVPMKRYRGNQSVGFKVMAYSSNNGRYYSCFGEPDVDSAISCAKQKCKALKNSCDLYAVGNKIVRGMDEAEIDLYKNYYQAVLEPNSRNIELAQNKVELAQPDNPKPVDERVIAPKIEKPNPIDKPITVAKTPGSTDQSVEMLYWDSIKDFEDKAYFEAYLKRWPDGNFADIAKLRIASLDDNAGTIKTERPSKEPEQLVRDVQSELNRVGCSVGRVDGKWGRSSQRALKDFAKRQGLELVSFDPDEETLEILEGIEDRVCPLVCGRNQEKRNGRCVTKKKANVQKRAAPSKVKPSNTQVADGEKNSAGRICRVCEDSFGSATRAAGFRRICLDDRGWATSRGLRCK